MANLNSFDRRILENCPGSTQPAISMQYLIVSKLHGGSGYSDYVLGIEYLERDGYLTRDPQTNSVKRTPEGDKALGL